VESKALSAAAERIADRFRQLSFWLLLVSAVIAVVLTAALRIRVDPTGSTLVECLVAGLLLASRIWWRRTEHERMADACGTVGVVALGGMACGAIAMLELRLHFPLADPMLYSADRAIGIDGIAIVEWLLRQGHWVFWVMAPAYNLTIPIFFVGLIILAWIGDRVEAWRAAFCFVGTLLTTCLIAMLTPAKGLGLWAPPALLERLPEQAMRTFWHHFDEFYFGADPVLRMQVVDGVISFPSFHAIVGFLVLAMWRKHEAARAAAGVWLAIMLVATLPGGGHYFVDLLAGLIVWAAWFALSRWIERSAGAASVVSARPSPSASS
jgi:membrane-associated phospholipid phosphatase